MGDWGAPPHLLQVLNALLARLKRWPSRTGPPGPSFRLGSGSSPLSSWGHKRVKGQLEQAEAHAPWPRRPHLLLQKHVSLLHVPPLASRIQDQLVQLGGQGGAFQTCPGLHQPSQARHLRVPSSPSTTACPSPPFPGAPPGRPVPCDNGPACPAPRGPAGNG